MVEQLSLPPMATAKDGRRATFQVHGTNYLDAFSLQLRAGTGFGPAELFVRGAGRAFLQLSDRTQPTRETYAETEKATLGVEFARYFISSNHTSGRLGVEFLRDFPINRSWVVLGLQTGVVASVESAWDLGIGLRWFEPLERRDRFVNLSLSILGKVETTWIKDVAVGLTLGWTQRMRPSIPDATPELLTYEFMLFSVAPVLSLAGELGRLRLLFPVRLGLDISYQNVEGRGVITGYPSELSPDVSLAWDVAL